MIRVTVWNEGVHEVESPEIAAVYPHGIHGQIKSFLDTQEDIEVRTTTLYSIPGIIQYFFWKSVVW